jgi:hypothetical protein
MKPFTHKQDQYLAFIHYYGKINGRPPAEADMERYFRVSPPSVHHSDRPAGLIPQPYRAGPSAGGGLAIGM